jgi:addiction module HigA family antidote
MQRGIKHNTHPGELVYEDILKENNLTVSKAAQLLMVTRSALSNVLNGKAAISPIMAIRLEKVFGGSASFWVKMQASYDLREAEQTFYENSMQLKRFDFGQIS